jgi:DNA-binding winged helix-turn-helix (wHTH) protein
MSAISRPAGQADGPFQFGPFTFDCSSRQLLQDGVERHLSPKAQQLLRLLLLARPRALSREELYDALWPSTFVCETNLASVVNEVRRAIGDDARAAQFIRTLHGFGYAFCGKVTSAASSRSTAAVLVCGGLNYLLCEGENAVGRAPEGQVVITDPTISRHHALITVRDGAVFIMDLDSKNGTQVNGQRISRSPVMVTHRERIEFGAVAASIMFRRLSSTQSLQLNMPELKRQVERMTMPS